MPARRRFRLFRRSGEPTAFSEPAPEVAAIAAAAVDEETDEAIDVSAPEAPAHVDPWEQEAQLPDLPDVPEL